MVRRQSQLTTNDRRPWENPYLILGVDHGAPPEVWKQAWRRTRAEKAHDIDQLSRVNEAKDMIMTLERDGTNGWGRGVHRPARCEDLEAIYGAGVTASAARTPSVPKQNASPARSGSGTVAIRSDPRASPQDKRWQHGTGRITMTRQGRSGAKSPIRRGAPPIRRNLSRAVRGCRRVSGAACRSL